MTILERLAIEEELGFVVTEEGEIKAPCGCYACSDGVQQGHFACEAPPAALLQAEKAGQVVRSYDDGAWRWYVTVA